MVTPWQVSHRNLDPPFRLVKCRDLGPVDSGSSRSCGPWIPGHGLRANLGDESRVGDQMGRGLVDFADVSALVTAGGVEIAEDHERKVVRSADVGKRALEGRLARAVGRDGSVRRSLGNGDRARYAIDRAGR